MSSLKSRAFYSLETLFLPLFPSWRSGLIPVARTITSHFPGASQKHSQDPIRPWRHVDSSLDNNHVLGEGEEAEMAVSYTRLKKLLWGGDSYRGIMWVRGHNDIQAEAQSGQRLWCGTHYSQGAASGLARPHWWRKQSRETGPNTEFVLWLLRSTKPLGEVSGCQGSYWILVLGVIPGSSKPEQRTSDFEPQFFWPGKCLLSYDWNHALVWNL